MCDASVMFEAEVRSKLIIPPQKVTITPGGFLNGVLPCEIRHALPDDVSFCWNGSSWSVTIYPPTWVEHVPHSSCRQLANLLLTSFCLQLTLRCINVSSSAFLAVSFSSVFFDDYQLVETTVLHSAVLMKVWLAD